MSTHKIGFYEDLTKIIFQLPSNMNLISSSEFTIPVVLEEPNSPPPEGVAVPNIPPALAVVAVVPKPVRVTNRMICLFDVLLNIHGKQLRSCRDNQLF